MDSSKNFIKYRGEVTSTHNFLDRLETGIHQGNSSDLLNTEYLYFQVSPKFKLGMGIECSTNGGRGGGIIRFL